MSEILIADDNSQNVYMLEALLKGHGHSVTTARNGAEALEKAREVLPDLIISDILMPVMDGFELCRRIKRDSVFNRIPLIFYTATYTEPKDEQFALKLGADRFVIKPQEPEYLISVVDEVLAEYLETPEEPMEDHPLRDSSFCQEYSEVLFRKLEKKIGQLEDEIRKRKRAEDALRRSELRYRRIFETALDALILVEDREGLVVDVNPRTVELLGYSWGELAGHPVWAIDTLKKIVPSKSVLDGYLSMCQVQLKEIHLNRKDGTPFSAEIVSCFYPSDGGKILQINIRDISGRNEG